MKYYNNQEALLLKFNYEAFFKLFEIIKKLISVVGISYWIDYLNVNQFLHY